MNELNVSDEILKGLSPHGANSREDTKKQLANLKEHESIVSQYKDLIQEQVGEHGSSWFFCWFSLALAVSTIKLLFTDK